MRNCEIAELRNQLWSRPAKFRNSAFPQFRNSLLDHSKHRRMMCFQYFAVAEIHMHATRQAGIEASHRTHYVDPLKVLGPILLKDWGVLYRILIRSRCAIDIARIGVPWCRRIGMIVSNLAIPNYYVV